ncbi:MAG: Mitochondrial succinate-fumarate transporter [Trichoglossum hirsutum]|nr:MAG: Mitochondrial succinate-fumarate transporter [Trichoglossum hirsutum]
MSTKNAKGNGNGKKPASAATNLIAGGGAGMMEALACHPLDTIKVRMQLSRRARAPGVKRRGFLKTGAEIVRRETPLGLYKGLGAVLTGIVPKMAIRFTSFESYKKFLANKETGKVSGQATFVGKVEEPSWVPGGAGLAAGVTEAVAVVTPMEVVKIRLQAQHHSMADPLDVPKYRNAAHALYTVVKEEGVGALYRGVSLTALRQGTNQAANFTAYSKFKSMLQNFQPDKTAELPSWQTMIIGLVSGAMGPLSNAPIDTIKTRLQKTPSLAGESALSRITSIARDMFKQEGVHAFYKGITPRIMRVAPGQAVTFTVYEFLKEKLENSKISLGGGKYEE